MEDKMGEMDRDNAIEYLERKGKIEGKKTFTKTEEKQIKEVMKEGKIYGDPCFEIA
jgi:hypothetical protein